MIRIRLKKVGITLGLILLAWIAAALAVLRYPQPFFPWSVKVGGLAVYSDQAFAPADGEKILAQVQSKLATSPLYSSNKHFAIFICNTSWRRALFFIGDHHAGGLVYFPLSRNVFLSGADFAQNRLISPTGMADVLGRKLDHFMAHEIAHVLTGEAMGWLPYHALPVWIREGYAEYVGSQGVFDYREAEEAFRLDAARMNTPPGIPYLRYNFLVAYLLEQEEWSPGMLFEAAPTQEAVEAMVREKMAEENAH